MNEEEISKFVSFWKSIENKATELIRLRNSETEDYWSPRGLHSITELGLEFYDLVPEQYDDGYTVETRYLPWDDLLDYDNQIVIEKSRIESKKRKQAEQASFWERSQYERLKAKFEDNHGK